VLTLARRCHWPPDLLLLTGDLAEQPTPSAYQRLGAMLADIGMPIYAIPGNHDDPDLLTAWLCGPTLRAERRIRLASWQIILLDSTLPGAVAGALAPDQLELLEQALGELPRHHALVALHHPPVPVGSPWMDALGLRDAAPLFEILDRHAQVRGVLWGHVHQVFEGARNGVRLMGSPSTCVQFLPGAPAFAIDHRPPGYRWLELAPDGGIRTGVCRLGDASERGWSACA
jgi:Icc protein